MSGKVQIVESTEFRNNIAEFFNRVIYQDAELIITRRNKPLAKISKLNAKEKVAFLADNPEFKL